MEVRQVVPREHALREERKHRRIFNGNLALSRIKAFNEKYSGIELK
jgi:hypothetical protein